MKPEFFIKGMRGNWTAHFKIGVQTFTVCERHTLVEAKWYIKQLKTAFKNLNK